MSYKSSWSKGISYRSDVDGLRALAVTSVVCYHIGLGWVKGGFVGVDVFFVISGYLIGFLVYSGIRDNEFSLPKFYARRAKRILPALSVVLIFCYVAASLLLSPHETRNFASEALATVTSTSNILYALFTPGYFHPNTDLRPLLMTWSLGVEEQFYIIFPLTMLLLCKARVRTQFWVILGLAVMSLMVSIWGVSHYPTLTFYLLPTRAWELAAGVLLAIAEANRPRQADSLPIVVAHGMSVVGFGLILIAIIVLDRSTPFPGSAALLPVIGTLLIIAAQRGFVNRLLSWKPIVFVGLVSYSWYLWHWPILTFARIVCAAGISREIRCFLGLVSFGCAVITYKVIEQPFRKPTTPTTLLLKRYAFVILLLILPASFLYLTQGLYRGNVRLRHLDQVSNVLLMDKCAVELSEAHPPLKPPCVPTGDGPAVAIIGDSHATALASTIRKITEMSGYRLIELAKGACPAMDGDSASREVRIGLSSECQQFDRESLNYIIGVPAIRVVVVAEYWSEDLAATRGSQGGSTWTGIQGKDARGHAEKLASDKQRLDEVVTDLEHAGKIVYLVQDNANFSFDPVQLMRSRFIRPRRLLARVMGTSSQLYTSDFSPDASSPADLEGRALVEKVASTHPKVRVLDLRKALCSAAGCEFATGNETLYIDNNHLSVLGAQIALADLRFP